MAIKYLSMVIHLEELAYIIINFIEIFNAKLKASWCNIFKQLIDTVKVKINTLSSLTIGVNKT